MDGIDQRVSNMRERLWEYQQLLKMDLPDPAVIYLGDGYFAQMALPEAREFMQRKISTIETDLAALNQLQGLNEDGLPVFDIVEELDDDGNVIDSKVQRSGLSEQLSALKVANSMRDIAGEHLPDHSEPLSDGYKPVGFAPDAEYGADDVAKTRVVELQAPAQSSSYQSDSNPDDEVQYIENVSDESEHGSLSEDNASGDYRDIDSSDVLELEILGADSDEDVNFDFDNIEEDSDETSVIESDESSDEGTSSNHRRLDKHERTHYNNIADDDDDDENDEDDNEDDDEEGFDWRGGFFPNDEATRRLIEAHLNQQDPPASSQAVPAKAKPKKSGNNAHVHFADTVNVREFETTSAERKGIIDDAPRKTSRFRTARQASKTMGTTGALTKSLQATKPMPPKSAAAAAAAAVAASPRASNATTPSSPHNAANNASAIHESVIERSAGGISPVRKPVGRTVTGKASVFSSRRPASLLTSKAASNLTEQPSRSSTQTSAGGQSSETSPRIDLKVAQTKKTELTEGVPLAGSRSSPESESTPAGAPPGGEGDPKSSRKSKVAQAAKKYYEDSFIPDDKFLEVHDHSNDDDAPHPPSEGRGKDQDEKAVASKTEDDRPVVSDTVVERDSSENSGSTDNIDENAVDMREIKKEYHRLKQRLIYESGGYKKKDSEKEVEAVESDGNPKKVSRFKAARIDT